MPQGLLKAEDYEVGRLHVLTLMKTMGIEALYPTGSAAKCIAGRATTPDQEYLDIIAFILHFNGYPAGENELRPDPAHLEQITLTLAP